MLFLLSGREGRYRLLNDWFLLFFYRNQFQRFAMEGLAEGGSGRRNSSRLVVVGITHYIVAGIMGVVCMICRFLLHVDYQIVIVVQRVDIRGTPRIASAATVATAVCIAGCSRRNDSGEERVRGDVVIDIVIVIIIQIWLLLIVDTDCIDLFASVVDIVGTVGIIVVTVAVVVGIIISVVVIIVVFGRIPEQRQFVPISQHTFLVFPYGYIYQR